jgi:Zn-dependent protease with chaperone function
MASNFYPTSPQVTTQKLTALTSSYKFRAFLAILSIILFFVLYVLLVIAIGFFVKWTITALDFNSSSLYVLIFHFGIIAAAVMLFLFTLKFILKLRNHKPENRLQLSKQEYPDLWNFVLQICEETGAPKPRRIYADPDVNAYVNYTNTWLSLFLPVQKDLTVGLGLVSCLNLSEFKAVVSHEFGHFAQSSMKIGSYIHSANTIIHDMIFSRDSWDTILEEWRGAELRLSQIHISEPTRRS